MPRRAVIVLAVALLAGAKPLGNKPNPVEFQNAVAQGALQILSQSCTPDSDDAPNAVLLTLFRPGDGGALAAQPTRVGPCRWVDANGYFEAGLFGVFAAATALDWSKLSPDANTWTLLGGRDRSDLDETFRRAFGEPLVARSAWNGFNMRRFYNPKAFEAAFAKLYVKPSETRVGATMQVIYDSLAKDRVTALVRAIASVRAKKGWLDEKSKAFETEAAAKGSGFYYADFVYPLTQEIATGEEEPVVDARTLSFLLRRQGDGTLAVIAKLLKTIAKDYDPPLFKAIGDKL